MVLLDQTGYDSIWKFQPVLIGYRSRPCRSLCITHCKYACYEWMKTPTHRICWYLTPAPTCTQSNFLYLTLKKKKKKRKLVLTQGRASLWRDLENISTPPSEDCDGVRISHIPDTDRMFRWLVCLIQRFGLFTEREKMFVLYSRPKAVRFYCSNNLALLTPRYYHHKLWSTRPLTLV